MKERSIVLNTMYAEAGEILEKNRNHMICKNKQGKIEAVFSNLSQEETAIKLTLTALMPSCVFALSFNGIASGCKKANAAGILECRMILPANGKLTVCEQ